MKTKLGCWMLMGLTLLLGCVPSLNPVYTDQSLRFDPNVVGVWAQANGKDKWEFTKRDDTSYRLVYTDKQGRQGRFLARLAEIEGTRFLDLFPEETDTSASGFYRFHLVPIHTVYLVKGTEPDLQLAAIDYRWLEEFLTENPDAIQFATFNGRKLITAPTDDVQAFVLEHREMFTADFKLQRQTERAN